MKGYLIIAAMLGAFLFGIPFLFLWLAGEALKQGFLIKYVIALLMILYLLSETVKR